MKCPFCGSHRTKTVGGADGNPYNGQRAEKTICLDCGRTLSTAIDLSALPQKELDQKK